MPAFHVGQNETIRKQNSLSSKEWIVDGESKLRKKTEGKGIMISALMDEIRGFGFSLTNEEMRNFVTLRAIAVTSDALPMKKVHTLLG
jgi:hypothetical protein